MIGRAGGHIMRMVDDDYEVINRPIKFNGNISTDTNHAIGYEFDQDGDTGLIRRNVKRRRQVSLINLHGFRNAQCL